MTIDGQVGEPSWRWAIASSAAAPSIPFNWCAHHNMYFFDVLREKLKWGGR